VLELLVALIIAKPVMILALSVGVSALGGVGATGDPGDAVGDNLARELGTLISGVITFGLAAFMPFLVWKLMPIVAAAVVAQGIASAPVRGGTQAMQLQYYGQAAMRRLSGGSAPGQTVASAAGLSPASAAGSGGAGFAAGGAVGGATGATAAAPAAGPAAPVVAGAALARSVATTATTAVGSTAKAAASRPSGVDPASPSDLRRPLGGDR
jgi:hypothetical protein